ncbi:CPBP family intramembrane glutamic endopeptidase [Natronobacterium texcoconense]|uniref:CAAX prenyl protease 2/Lysostaphin resistance protein A-like domain-containing protein n=1 Tax=Natronobacterium texcoconense TaxID=1095778 RepID=A0A1H1J098_NATTX|nr:CPBP family intramembrane glutamic endopeptidase [Natronobacterium texcoconense]SDR43404.1 hypothetical protein SAMN04489842_3953 [Natronobacterium texcoconense]
MSSPQPPEGESEGLPERSPLIAAAGAIGYVVGVFAFVIAASIVLTAGLAIAFFLADTPETFEWLLTGDGSIYLVVAEALLLGFGTVAAALLSFSLGWIPKRVVGFAVPTGRQLLVGVGATVGLVVLAALLSALVEFVGAPASDHALFDEDAPVSYYVVLAVLSILVIGPVEELLFRGLIQNYLRSAVTPVWAVVWTSVLFAVVHLPAYLTGAFSTAVASLAVIFVLSLVLGAIYERYRNVVLVMLIHGFYNAVLFGFEIVA